jgi:hypothetical protein
MDRGFEGLISKPIEITARCNGSVVKTVNQAVTAYCSVAVAAAEC